MNNETIKNAKRVFTSVTKYLEFEEKWDDARNNIRNYTPKSPKIIFNDRERRLSKWKKTIFSKDFCSSFKQEERSKLRSKTYIGIAKAIAEQWTII